MRKVTQSPQPFPWVTLDHLTRDDVRAARDAARWFAGHTALAKLEQTLGEIFAAPVSTRFRRAERGGPLRPIPDGVAVVLAAADSPALARGVVVQVESAFAARAVRAVLRRPLRVEAAPPGRVPSSVAGAFASVAHAVLRRAHAGVALRVLAAGPAAALEQDLAREFGATVAVSVTLLVGDDAFHVRAIVPADVAAMAPAPGWDQAALAALGPVPLSVPVVAASAGLTATDVGRLATGDVLILPAWPLRVEADGLAGPVHLAPPGSAVGLRADLRPDGQLVLGGHTERLVTEEDRMPEKVGRPELIDAIGEVPVVVRVEIGETTMAAREWAALGEGDVLTLPRRVGDRVALRVGGIVVARGELVSVDGDVGVRVVERLRAGVEP